MKVWKHSMISYGRLFALGIAWVGGWGFLFFNNPEFICRLGGVKAPTIQRLRMVKTIGAIELAVAFTSCLLTAIFGLPSK
jgi:hypothetical protein